MAQIFPRWTNELPLRVAVGGVVAAALLVGGIWYYFSPRYTDVGYAPVQPVAYSHRLHAGELGIDCLYCHSTVDRSPVAVVPPTQVCMNCHHVVRRDSTALAAIRQEIESRVRAQMEAMLGRMDLVTREEFEVVREMAATARAGEEALAERVVALEARIAALEAGGRTSPQSGK